jgi:catalase
MATTIAGGLYKAQEVVKSATSKNKKLVDLERDVTDVHTKTPFTTDHGVPVSNTDNWLKVVDDRHTGPSLLEDQIAREKVLPLRDGSAAVPNKTQIHRFDHERIPERVVHARGTGAFGNFKLKESAEDVTTAGVLTDTTRNTPVFVRFSTVQGSRGSADTVRDVRGFAVKFYTDEGNWDLVGNNIPVFFIQDAIKFPDFGEYAPCLLLIDVLSNGISPCCEAGTAK